MVYPTMLSGIIVEVGADVTSRRNGDRVIANCDGVSTTSSRSAFQYYVLLSAADTTLLPAHIPLETGLVLPLACDTAAAGLFMPDQLGLATSKLSSTSPSTTTAPGPRAGSTLLVWGASSSVGCCAIQMARATGYSVLATSSARNHALCESLGAQRVFDYADLAVEDAIVQACVGRRVVGALDCICDGEGSLMPCARVLARALEQERQEVEVGQGRDGFMKISTVLAPPQGAVLPRGVGVTRCKCFLVLKTCLSSR